MTRLMPIKYDEYTLVEFQITFTNNDDCATHCFRKAFTGVFI